MEHNRPDRIPSSQQQHDHPVRPLNACPGCTQRFGTVISTTVRISELLGGDREEAAALIQLVWTMNKQLDRIASTLEKLGALIPGDGAE